MATIGPVDGSGKNGDRINVWIEYTATAVTGGHKITATLYAQTKSDKKSTTSKNNCGKEASITINGVKTVLSSNISYDFRDSTGRPKNSWGSATTTVSHTAAKTIEIKGTFATTSEWITGGTVTGSVTLPARTYTLTLNKGTGVASFTGGGAITCNTKATTTATASTGYHLTSYSGTNSTGTGTTSWTISGGTSDTTTWQMDANRTITCYAAKDTYKISYAKGDGSSGSVAAQTKEYGTAITLQKNGYTKNSVSATLCMITLNNNGTTSSKTITKTTSYAFNGWKDGNDNKIYSAGASYSVNKATTMTAQWKGTDSYSTVTLGVPTRTATSVTGNTVTFDSKGGSAVSSRSNKITTNYTFKNWNAASNGSGTAYSGTTAYTNSTFSSNITLTAQWNTSTSPSSIEIPPYPTKTYYYCEEWNTKSDGTGTKYLAGAKFTPSTNITLYAIWKPNWIIINYYGNGADGVNSQYNTNIGKATKTTQVTYDNKNNVNLYDVSTLFSKLGYTGSAWRVGSATAATTWSQAGQTIPDSYFRTNNTSVNLYAVWTPNNYKVTFNANATNAEICDDEKEKQVTYDSVYGDLPEPTREGHVLTGWFTANGNNTAEVGVQITPTSKVKITNNITLYAHWRDADLDKTYLNSFVKAKKKRTNNFNATITKRFNNYKVLREDIDKILADDNLTTNAKLDYIDNKITKASEKGLIDMLTTFKREPTIVEDTLDAIIPYSSDTE